MMISTDLPKKEKWPGNYNNSLLSQLAITTDEDVGYLVIKRLIEHI